MCWVFVEAGLQGRGPRGARLRRGVETGQADLKVGLYTNTSGLRVQKRQLPMAHGTVLFK